MSSQNDSASSSSPRRGSSSSRASRAPCSGTNAPTRTRHGAGYVTSSSRRPQSVLGSRPPWGRMHELRRGRGRGRRERAADESEGLRPPRRRDHAHDGGIARVTSSDRRGGPARLPEAPTYVESPQPQRHMLLGFM